MALGLGMAATIMVTGSGLLGRTRRRGEVYVNPIGVYRHPGGYLPLFTLGQALREVTVVPEVAGTYLCFHADVRRRRGTRRYTERIEVSRLLVPAAHAEDARMLVERFNTELLSR